MFKLSKTHEKNILEDSFIYCVWNKKLKDWKKYEGKEPIVFSTYKVLTDSVNDMDIAYLSEFETDEYLVFGFYPTKYCLSYRKRPDGFIGFSGLFGSNTLLSNHKLDKKVVDEEIERRQRYIKKVGLENYATGISITESNKIDWNKDTSVFIMKDKNDK